MTRAEVMKVQRELNSLGEKLVVDGVLGPKTAAAMARHPAVKPDPYTPPPWLTSAISLIGEREIKGKAHNPKILDMWRLTHLAFADDETPWCAGFVGYCLEVNGIRSSRSGAARSYSTLPGKFIKLALPAPGAIAVYWRGSPKGYQGHTNIVWGWDPAGRLICIGGNQDDMVNAAPYGTSRLIGYYWPAEALAAGIKPQFDKRPLVQATKERVTQEA